MGLPQLYFRHLRKSRNEYGFGGRKITFADPFDNFLVYGGANSGKTKSIGKPLLSQYIQAGFAGFVYNYKDFDLARTAVHLVKKHN